MVWRWDETEKSESRRVWLECYGVPLHAWSKNTFCRIGEQWGEVVECDKLMEACNSFSAGKVLIDTCVFDMINEWIHVKVGASGFDVMVREVGGEVYREECFRDNRTEAEDRHIINIEEMKYGGLSGISKYGDEQRVVDWDQAAVLMTADHRNNEQDEDMIVISSLDLNEWNHRISNFPNENGSYAELVDKADS
ncbi:hypothetical protein AHAS_Ahas13G0284000 [Arachis hypogaea]